ncbi:MAG: chemotaxis protein CheA [bacterium]|nr:chemotaxis protein CheA [bacterium]
MESNAEIYEQGRKIFIEEAAEKLEELQEALMNLEDQPESPDLVNQAFRALHTIKGSGSMFGFDRISSFTHEVETCFDAVRSGTLPVTPELIEAAFAAHDQIQAMLVSETQGASAQAPDPAPLLERFARFRPDRSETEVEPSQKTMPVPDNSESGALRHWAIHFRPHPNILSNGTKVRPLLSELCSLGEAQTKVDTSHLPPLEEMDPESCYLAWNVELETDQDENALRDVFIFVEDECQLDICLQEDSVPNQAGAAQPVPQPLEPQADAPQAARVPDLVAKLPSPHLVQDSNIKVSSGKLDIMVDLVGELVTAQARLQRLANSEEQEELVAVAEEIERLTADLRDTTMTMRMVAIGSTFNRFKRLVRDLSNDLPQKAQLETDGGETELDKSMIDRLADPLVHIIRNSLDHGIEPPEERAAAGKPPEGVVRLSAQHVAGQVLVSISDDGKGLDPQRIREKAISKGLIQESAELSDRELFGLIFQPGFSTKEKVTSVSGRGVGMDVVKRSVESLRGSVEIESHPGQGTLITLRLPLTLAIIDGLLVTIDQAPFVLPLSSIEECVELSRADIEQAKGRNLALVRGDLVPYVHLRKALQIEGSLPSIQHLIVTQLEGKRIGFVVDEVVGGHQTVIKSLGRYFEQLKNLSGATILGDGSIALILDLNRLTQEVQSREDKSNQHRGAHV